MTDVVKKTEVGPWWSFHLGEAVPIQKVPLSESRDHLEHDPLLLLEFTCPFSQETVSSHEGGCKLLAGPPSQAPSQTPGRGDEAAGASECSLWLAFTWWSAVQAEGTAWVPELPLGAHPPSLVEGEALYPVSGFIVLLFLQKQTVHSS